jgi:hypothetical protein
MSDLLLYGIIAYLIADWVFQNHWMAMNKSHPSHPAAWVHGAIHFIAMLFIFPFLIAAIIAMAHILIDTRKPVEWWQTLYRQTTEGVYALHVSIWLDQVFHIIVICFAVWLTTIG